MTTPILLISGSTRAGSTNTAAIRTARDTAPADVDTRIYDGMARLPHFNPDEEVRQLPAEVRALRREIEDADAILISTPEYAGAMPGALKNLLEWTIGAEVGAGSLYDKPVGWINVSPRPNGAQATYDSLRSVLGYAHADIAVPACQRVPVARAIVDERGEITDAGTIAGIADGVSELVTYTRNRRD